jgi:hypothetical protein
MQRGKTRTLGAMARCPNCAGSISVTVERCPACGATFGNEATWRPVPTKAEEMGGKHLRAGQRSASPSSLTIRHLALAALGPPLVIASVLVIAHFMGTTRASGLIEPLALLAPLIAVVAVGVAYIDSPARALISAIICYLIMVAFSSGFGILLGCGVLRMYCW